MLFAQIWYIVYKMGLRYSSSHAQSQSGLFRCSSWLQIFFYFVVCLKIIIYFSIYSFSRLFALFCYYFFLCFLFAVRFISIFHLFYCCAVIVAVLCTQFSCVHMHIVYLKIIRFLLLHTLQVKVLSSNGTSSPSTLVFHLVYRTRVMLNMVHRFNFLCISVRRQLFFLTLIVFYTSVACASDLPAILLFTT